MKKKDIAVHHLFLTLCMAVGMAPVCPGDSTGKSTVFNRDQPQTTFRVKGADCE
jgi:hypothetical protein